MCSISSSLESQFSQIFGFIPSIIQQPLHQHQVAPPAMEMLLHGVRAVLLLLALSIPFQGHPLPGPASPSTGQGLESEQSWELPEHCEGTINYKKQQGITMELRIGCLGKYTLGMGDSETDPAPLKLEKASKKQSPKPTLQRNNKNAYIEKG